MAQDPSIEQIVGRLHEAFIVLNRNWECIYANEKAASIVGRSIKDLLGKSLWDACPDLVGTRVEEECRESFLDQIPRTFDYWHLSAQSWFEVDLYPSKQDLALVFRDISERKRVEELLRQS